jgi:hypothetical protein
LGLNTPFELVLPEKMHISEIVTSADVRWTVPSLGVKCDAVPGRLNQISTFLRLLVHGTLTIAYCEGRMGMVEFPRALETPLPELPAEDPFPNLPQAPAPPYIPTFANPLIEEALRRAELYQRLSIYFIGQNDSEGLSRRLDMLERQFLVEIRVEAALCHAGFDPNVVVAERQRIRDVIF